MLDSSIFKLTISSFKLNITTARNEATGKNNEAHKQKLLKVVHKSAILKKVFWNGALFNFIECLIHKSLLWVLNLFELSDWCSIWLHELLREYLADLIILWHWFDLSILTLADSQGPYSLAVWTLSTCKPWPPLKHKMAIIGRVQLPRMTSILNKLWLSIINFRIANVIDLWSVKQVEKRVANVTIFILYMEPILSQVANLTNLAA